MTTDYADFKSYVFLSSRGDRPWQFRKAVWGWKIPCRKFGGLPSDGCGRVWP